LAAGGDARIYLQHTQLSEHSLIKTTNLGFHTTCATLRLVAERALATPNGNIFWTTAVGTMPNPVDEVRVLAVRKFFLLRLSFKLLGTLG
jgi:hypothetical protein